MGWDKSILHQENIAKRLSPADRKAAKVTTADEAREKYKAGQEDKLQSDIRNFFVHVRPPVYVHAAPFKKKAQGKPGRADFVGCYRGRWFSFEAKTPFGVQTPEQKVHEREVIAAGGIYRIVRSARDVHEALRQIDSEEAQ